MYEVKIFGRALINQNCMHEEIKGRLHIINVCYHLVQNLLCCHMLPRNIEFKNTEQ